MKKTMITVFVFCSMTVLSFFLGLLLPILKYSSETHSIVSFTKTFLDIPSSIYMYMFQSSFQSWEWITLNILGFIISAKVILEDAFGF